MITYRLEKKGIPSESGGGFGEVPVQLQFSRLDFPLDIVYPVREHGIRGLFLFEFVFSPELVCAVANEGLEPGDPFQEDIADTRDDGGGLLATGQCFGQSGVDAVHVQDVPEHSADE